MDIIASLVIDQGGEKSDTQAMSLRTIPAQVGPAHVITMAIKEG